MATPGRARSRARRVHGVRVRSAHVLAKVVHAGVRGTESVACKVSMSLFEVGVCNSLGLVFAVCLMLESRVWCARVVC